MPTMPVVNARFSGILRASAILCALCLCVHGCNIVEPIAIIAEGPPTIDAEYELLDRSTVVFVDDRRNILADRAIRRYIGDKVSEHLLSAGVVGDAISTGDALAVVGAEQAGALKPIEEIGKDVGAAQIIYVEMLKFALEAPDGQPTATAELQVKVIDVENSLRIFPADDADTSARMMLVMLPPDQAFQPMLGRSARREAEYTLADLVAERVAKLFYEHERHSGSPSGLAPATSR
jgi:hypothetical protein